MRDDLMTEALCWDIEEKVSAEWAHAAKPTGDFAFYCPHEICLVKVHPAAKKNTYFVATDRHLSGCPDESRPVEPSARPGVTQPRSAHVPDASVPSLLGAPPKLKPKTQPPTRTELLQLSRKVQTAPVLHPGTLAEVIDAWIPMHPDERRLQRLIIGGQSLNYDDAFTFAGQLSRPCDIAALRLDTRVLWGLATVRIYEQWVLIESRKKFSSMGAKEEVPLRSKMKLGEAPACLMDLVDQNVTGFWHGISPVLSPNKNGLVFGVDLNSLYSGVVLRSGHLAP